MQFNTAAEARAYELGKRHMRVVEEPAKPVFKTNAKGQPEYATIQIVMDHLMENDTGHVNTKLTLSTEEPEQALRSLWDYYGETSNLLSMKSTLDLLVEHRMDPNGVFLYVVPAEAGDRFGGLRLEVVMSTDLFSKLTAHPNFGDGSEFLCIQNLTKQFAQVMADVRRNRDGFPPLTYIGLEGAALGNIVHAKPEVSHEDHKQDVVS